MTLSLSLSRPVEVRMTSPTLQGLALFSHATRRIQANVEACNDPSRRPSVGLNHIDKHSIDRLPLWTVYIFSINLREGHHGKQGLALYLRQTDLVVDLQRPRCKMDLHWATGSRTLLLFDSLSSLFFRQVLRPSVGCRLGCLHPGRRNVLRHQTQPSRACLVERDLCFEELQIGCTHAQCRRDSCRREARREQSFRTGLVPCFSHVPDTGPLRDFLCSLSLRHLQLASYAEFFGANRLRGSTPLTEKVKNEKRTFQPALHRVK